MKKQSGAKDDIVVFWILRESTCFECGEELESGRFLRKEGDRPLCLSCSDLDHLVFLPRGNTALTRRASKHSTLRTVVVRFSRTRKRYERQGILVEELALEQAENECLADADARAKVRERAAERRQRLDQEYVTSFAQRLGELYPGCPEPEQQAIARHACQIHSGRVGRSAAAKQLDPAMIDLAVRAHIRHVHTPYDRLLAEHLDRQDARVEVRSQVEQILESWKQPRPEP